MADYFYDHQIRRLIIQVCRMLGGFVVHTGENADGVVQVRDAPCRWGEPSRMVSQIMRKGSENTMLYTPLMSVHIAGISAAPSRRQNPTHVETDLVDEREFDNDTGLYTENLGDRFTVKRYMSVPYDFTFQLDIWTSNQDQKMQLLEQLMTLFNPSVDIQTGDNPLDWSAITFATLEDDITWTSRSIPMGTDEQIDISTMRFNIPYWINPPAEQSRRRAIETIVTNMSTVDELPVDDSDFSWSEGDNLYQSIITPGNHIIDVTGNEIKLLGDNGSDVDLNNEIYDWSKLLYKYSNFSDNKTNNLEIKTKFGDSDGIQGSIAFHTTESNILLWTIDEDTLPQDTLTPVDAITDPSAKFPGDGLPAAALGQRYLIADNITATGSIWGDITAEVNSIIEYTGTVWIVSFDSTAVVADTKQVVLNVFTNKQLRWNPEKKDWEFAVDGTYKPGTWKIIT